MPEQLSEPMLINTGDTEHPVPVSQAILEGYAPKNELYAYSIYPQISDRELKTLTGSNYIDIFCTVTSRLLGSAVPFEVLRATAAQAYSPDNFDFDPEDRNLGFTTLPNGIQVVDLSAGPTGAFKDMAMQPFARWVDYLQSENGDLLTFLLCTSGDTGPAALSAFGDLDNVEMVAMFPDEDVSAFQRAQMAEMDGRGGIHVLEASGNFSELNNWQMEANEVYELGAVNSANIARLIAQVPYHFASYLKAIERADMQIGDPIDFSIPSGNFGNALSAIIARKMGLPIRHIVVAANENHVLDIFFRTGVLKKFEKEDFIKTNSSAQDIIVPSNIWRYIGMLFGNDPDKIGQFWTTWNETGSANIQEIGVEDNEVSKGILSATIRAADRSRVIRDVYYGSNKKIIIDPHTANGVAAIENLGLLTQGEGVPILAMETAKPFKFDETIDGILGVMPPRPERFRGLEQRMAGVALTHITGAKELIAYLHGHTTAKPKNF